MFMSVLLHHIFFFRDSNRIKNPHLRAKLAECLAAFLPKDRSKQSNLFSFVSVSVASWRLISISTNTLKMSKVMLEHRFKVGKIRFSNFEAIFVGWVD